MLEYSLSKIALVSAHFIGNKANEQELKVSEQPLNLSDERLLSLLQRFFLDAFEGNEFFHFDFSNIVSSYYLMTVKWKIMNIYSLMSELCPFFHLPYAIFHFPLTVS